VLIAAVQERMLQVAGEVSTACGCMGIVTRKYSGSDSVPKSEKRLREVGPARV